ncbi:TPA: restriction endonuclease subunit S [Escherichia coli]|uniref:Restriction endonuclease subunit S n=1 Tax=Escherichia coli TaxID=562 RepID=A0A2W6P9I1_ECOLX|nr:restriction endonuclease subunit S [Escherichia coli]EFK49450.1 type I restriction modification DNA specificity domain protein [Escherichia coli MS 107-1]EGU95327.1 type I restriction enzyme EcoprrI specificity protein [Escherichia coli MS 79-10]PZT65072.1 restriction endonuclease subunit S [Escherichia coli]HAH5611293.1 restriction endonuclease subunit S [Escherichia coli]
MSELTYLEKLLDGVKVEWQTLGKVLKRTKGTKITAGQMKALHKDNAPLKIFAGGKTVAFVDFKDIPEKDINREPSIIVKSRGIIEFEYYDKPFSHKNEMWSYHSNNDAISIKYIYYFLKINEGYFQKIGGKMQMPQIATPDTDKFEVPIPCPDNPEKSLAIQSEIVRILDKFTELTAELTAELSMRKKQYNYYRDQLLSFKEDEVEGKRKTLGEIMKMRAGQHISAHNIIERKEESYIYPCFGGNGIRGYVKEKSHDGEHLLIGRQGALCGNVQRMKGQFYATEHAVVVSVMPGINIDWAFHMLTAMNLNQYASKSAQPGLAVGKLQELKLFVPSIERQIYIAAILDKFDTLTNSITEGLPREIELRQKQYEYYRDLLFSFPKPETVSN